MRIRISNDTERVNEIRKLIVENGGYCPCSFERSEETKCICKEFREKDTTGPCHCGLYIKTHD